MGALPWLASLWVDEPWKFGLWALGIALDVVVIAIYSPDDALDQVRRRAEGLQERHPDRGAFAVRRCGPRRRRTSASGSGCS